MDIKVQNGCLQIAGKPYFPIGMYYSDYTDLPGRATAASNAQAAGFNFFKAPVDRTDKPLLDQLKNGRMNFLLENNDGDPSEVVNAFKGHTALAMRYVADDCDQGNWTPASVEAKKQSFAIPGTVDYSSGGSSASVIPYISVCSVLGTQNYPVPYEGAQATYNAFKKLRPEFAKVPSCCWVANLQTFKWRTADRYPTPLELRLMTYGAIMAGVKGVFFYTFKDAVNPALTTQAALWRECVLLARELVTYSPYFLSGTPKDIVTGRTEVQGRYWILGNKALVIITNAYTNERIRTAVKLDPETVPGIRGGVVDEMSFVADNGPLQVTINEVEVN